MERITRRIFSKEFKEEAVGLLDGRSVKEEAESLGIRPNLLSRWRRQLADEGDDSFRSHGNRTALEEENHRLKHGLMVLREEKEILKKTSAYFARHLK